MPAQRLLVHGARPKECQIQLECYLNAMAPFQEPLPKLVVASTDQADPAGQANTVCQQTKFTRCTMGCMHYTQNFSTGTDIWQLLHDKQTGSKATNWGEENPITIRIRIRIRISIRIRIRIRIMMMMMMIIMTTIIVITRLPYTCLSAACSTSEVCLSELLMAAAVSAADAAKLEAAGE